MRDYGSLSLWHDQLPQPIVPRPRLSGFQTFDVAIVGAGYTGLWAAYYLAKADPHLRIGVLEKDVAGFGASGRNGGWCSAHFPASLEKMAATAGRAAAVAQIRALFATIDEVGRVVADEGIDARFHKGGTLRLAMNQAQLAALRGRLDHERAWGFGEEDYVLLSAPEARARVAVPNSLAGHYTPHCAAFDPARLARGLADVVEGLGVRLYERSPALSVGDRSVQTPAGVVTADVVVLAIEAYKALLPQFHRELVPLYSLMVATEPLSQEQRDTIGWGNRECVTDGRHLIIYLQLTADGRIAIGGRGAPYHFGSRIVDRYDRSPRVAEHLRQALLALFPSLEGIRLTHSWGGPLGVPRDWYCSAAYDRASGRAWAGGYVGNGVGISNLAGRTLRDLVLGQDSDLLHLPWVNHRSRRWEPEPLRWLAINGALQLMDAADWEEGTTGRPSRLGGAIKALVGM